jgi:hypothetical protein
MTFRSCEFREYRHSGNILYLTVWLTYCPVLYYFHPWSSVLLYKLMFSHIFNKFSAFCGVWTFITATCHCNIPEETNPLPATLQLKSIFILSCYKRVRFRSGLFLSVFPTKTPPITLCICVLPVYMPRVPLVSLSLVSSPKQYFVWRTICASVIVIVLNEDNNSVLPKTTQGQPLLL